MKFKREELIMEKKTSGNGLLAVMGALVIADIIVMICVIDAVTVGKILALAVMALVVLYLFWLYKKPHGNLLKYTMLLFALVILFLNATDYSGGMISIVNLIAGGLVCYCAGRLHKIKRNRIILLIIDIYWLIDGIWSSVKLEHVTFLNVFSNFTFFIVLGSLIIAYLIRYKEHREAGLLDRADAEGH